MKLWVLLAALLVISPAFAIVQSNSSITPSNVDTSVINQTFVYTINSFNETINWITINSSGAHNFTSLSDITLNGTSCRGVAGACTGGNVTVELNRINITFDTPFVASGTTVNVTFNTTTPFSYNISNFTSYVNSTVSGLALSVPNSLNSTIVTTQPMINVTGISITKGAAILNGTDYWEFKFVLGFAVSQAGMIQFRMTNWTETGGQTLGIYSGATNYATLRNETLANATGQFNVTNAYGGGINRTSATDYYLKMVLPSSAALSNSWSSTYNFLFRATP